jgi:hypothetical protein
MAPADDAREPRGILCAGARAPAGLVATRAESLASTSVAATTARTAGQGVKAPL